jgi:hypothetical protein
VVWNENPQIVEGAKSLTHKAQRYLRELLIEKEQYEEVVYLDKCLDDISLNLLVDVRFLSKL